MRRKTWAALVLATVLLTPGHLALAGNHDFILVNQTGLAMDLVYVVPLKATSWEDVNLCKGRKVILRLEGDVPEAHYEWTARHDGVSAAGQIRLG